MWNYEKRLEYPINIKNPDPKLAQMIITQFGGPDCKRIFLRFWLENVILKLIYFRQQEGQKKR